MAEKALYSEFHHALTVQNEVCIGCTHCMTVCPTQAIRVRKGKAIIIAGRCVDCGECYKACPVSAITSADFSRSHLDRQPLGDIAGVMKILMAANPDICFTYLHRTDNGEYSFSTRETMEYIGVSTLNDQCLLEDIKVMINENLREIAASGVEFEKTV